MIHCLQSLVLFIATIGSSSDLIYYLVLLLLLLLSGDVELNPGPITGNPKDILQNHSAKLVHAICVNLMLVTTALYTKGLIPQQTKWQMDVLVFDDYTKACKLVNVIEQQLESSFNPEQYLIDICHVLINQQHRTLTDIATSILHQLGQFIPDNVSSHTVLLSPVDDISNTPVTNIRGQSDVAKPISSIPDDVQGYDQPVQSQLQDYFIRISLPEPKPDDSANRVRHTSHVVNERNLKPGDHIYCHKKFWTHYHYGIYIGDSKVIHYSADDKGSLIQKLNGSHCYIRKTSLEDFCDGYTLRLVAYNCSVLKKTLAFFQSTCHKVKAMLPTETIKLAEYFLENPEMWGKYDIRNNNSETFACFCKTGLMDIGAQLHPFTRNVLTEWRKGAPCTMYDEAMENFKKKRGHKQKHAH